jgi:hypothetical protein
MINMNLDKSKSRGARLAMLGLTALVVVLVVVVVATSGGSSTSANKSSHAAASANAGTSASRTSFEQCMKEHGVTITPHAGANGAPRAHTGTRPGVRPGSGSPTREAAFKACGAPGQHAGGSQP